MSRRRNTDQMKFTVLSSLLLGCLLVMTVQGTSAARVFSGGQEGDKNKLDQLTRNTAAISAQKEPFERNGATAHMGKLGFGTMHHEETSVVDSKKGKGADGSGETSKISGKEENDGLKKSSGSFQAQKNDHQKHVMNGPKAYLKFAKFVIPRNSPTYTNIKCSQDCASSTSQQQTFEEPQGTTKKDETRSLTDAAKEIESLIYKDYKGRPSHKPPINNHGPNN